MSRCAFDIGTLYVSATIVAAFFGVAFLGFHAIGSGARGVLQWGLAYTLIAVGLTITLFRGMLPLIIYGPFANSLFIVSAVLLDAGTRDEGAAGAPLVDLWVPVFGPLLLLFFAYVVPSLGARLEVMFVSVSLVCVHTSVQIIRKARAAEDGSRTALITFSLFYTILAAALVVLVLLAVIIGPVDGLLNRHPLHAVLLPALMLFFIGAGMSKLWVHYMQAYAEAKRAATIDPLTGVRNRRYVLPELERLFQRSLREGRALACMMLDADAFKSVNDTHGHRKGDEVLHLLARRIVDAVREYDLVGRYGGEEFIIVVPELDPSQVRMMAERIHDSIGSAPLAGLEITVSVGVAFLSDADARADDLIHRADQALYRAKRAGRDRVEVDGAVTELADTP